LRLLDKQKIPMKGTTMTLSEANYLSLGTFRKNGVEVRTPVWFAEEDGTLYLFSNGAAGKVKRLRNSSRARVAPCDVRGKILGDWHEAEAHLLGSESGKKAAHQALLRRYGWQMSALDFFAGLFGRAAQREFIAVRLR
jgi:PPOX class probable F420-dependent enzyme